MRRYALILAGGTLLGIATGMSGATASTDSEAAPVPLAELRTFTDVLNLARRYYVEPIDGEELLHSAIAGMVSTLDPYSRLLEAEDYQAQDDATRGRFGGLGIEVDVRDARLYVSGVRPGTPAFGGGVRPGDLILAIDGQPVRGNPIPESIDALRGTPGSEVTLRLKSGDMPERDVTLIREYIAVPSVTAERLDGRFGYFRISHFHLGSADDLRNAIEDLQADDAQPLAGIVLDLRNNSGGAMKAALMIADGFLDDGLVVYTRGRYQPSQIEYRAQPGQWTADLPVVILVNRITASASEILTGALQDHGRAIVVGETTWGKGTVQSTFRLRDGAALRLTTARYFTPSGRSIDEHGIDPDFPIGAEKFRVSSDPTGDTEAGAPAFEPGMSVAEAIAAVSPEADIALGRALQILRDETGG